MLGKYENFTREQLIARLEALERRKKYGLVWEEERVREQFEQDSENAVPVLKEVKSRAVTSDPAQPAHILIEGDNYHALTVLNYTHQGKIDVIYIDPPYNTGNKDFKYNDRWVTKDDVYRHSCWLSFMDKRLRVAKALLAECGAIFISIDDNEFAQAKLLCDQILGEYNFVDCISWEKKSSAKGVPPRNMLVNIHEYILVYQRSENFKFIGEPRDLETFSNPDQDSRGLWRNTNIRSTVKSRSGAFEIIDPKTGRKFKDTWAYSKEELERLIKEDYIIFPRKEGGQVRKKEFLAEFKNINIPIRSSWGLFDNQKNTEMLKDLLGDYVFLNPKPLELMKYLLKRVLKPDGIIVDFFAGSGTTGHAVLDLNNQDGGKRQFILCTNNEENICQDICYPRLKKVIQGYKDNPALGGNLKYFKTHFIPKTANKDDLKIRVTRECTELLCLREGIFEEVTKGKAGDAFRIFEQTGRVMGIYYSLDRRDLPKLKKALNKMNGRKIVYCFTLDPLGLDEEDFEDWEGVELKDIPQKILDIFEGLK